MGSRTKLLDSVVKRARQRKRRTEVGDIVWVSPTKHVYVVEDDTYGPLGRKLAKFTVRAYSGDDVKIHSFSKESRATAFGKMVDKHLRSGKSLKSAWDAASEYLLVDR